MQQSGSKHTNSITGNLPEQLFRERMAMALPELKLRYNKIYTGHPNASQTLELLISTVEKAFLSRSLSLKERDLEKLQSKDGPWFLSNEIVGMSLYVDRFAATIKGLHDKLDYFKKLGVNFLHLMPLFESPADASDGGYAVSDFRKVDERFGTLEDLIALQKAMQQRNMYLMLDIVLNHTSDRHEWAMKARQGQQQYKDYYYFFKNRSVPDLYDQSMPEVFPEAAPGNFTYIEEQKEWVMTVFHSYQWDLNYTNPMVLIEMLDTVFFYANLGVDILRIDAPAFIWKQIGSSCQNLPQAHAILQLLKACIQVTAPGMALLGEAIVAPHEIMKYFGNGEQECDFAYNATQMALQWDALASADTRVMLAAQHELLKKPYGTSWITYTRCHDDIGLGYEDYMIASAGFDPYEHRRFLINYYSGNYYGSPAKGALFSVNEKTGDARISGSLAALCGLETALLNNDAALVRLSVQKILLMQAQSFFIGGIPMLFYGDECGYTTDNSYLHDDAKNYDNRWMHRPMIDWKKNKKIDEPGTIEHLIFSATQKLIRIRMQLPVIADKKNLTWLRPLNIHVAGFLRAWEQERIYCLFNFSNQQQQMPWLIVNENGMKHDLLHDLWSGKQLKSGKDTEYFFLQPYDFMLLQPV